MIKSVPIQCFHPIISSNHGSSDQYLFIYRWKNLKCAIIITHLRDTVTIRPENKTQGSWLPNLHFNHYTKAPFKHPALPVWKLSREGRRKKPKIKERKEWEHSPHIQSKWGIRGRKESNCPELVRSSHKVRQRDNWLWETHYLVSSFPRMVINKAMLEKWLLNLTISISNHPKVT